MDRIFYERRGKINFGRGECNSQKSSQNGNTKMLPPFLYDHKIKIGRDRLFNLLSANDLLIKKRKRRIQTTNSQHWLRKYANLIRDFVPTAPNQLWVSDITYWKINTGKHVYICFITDAYSHKIVGYQVGETMEAIESIRTLNFIHHSDRGIQYCSYGYVKLLQDNKIQISMTENGDPLENAVAERINDIMKQRIFSALSNQQYQRSKSSIANSG